MELRALDRFVADAAHELLAPLTSRSSRLAKWLRELLHECADDARVLARP